MFTIASLSTLYHYNVDDVLNAARDAISQLRSAGTLGQDGGFVITSIVHGPPDDRHLTARIFSSKNQDSQSNHCNGGAYLGGVHFQLDGSAPTFWGREELDTKSPYANMRRKKNWNTANLDDEMARSTTLGTI